MKTQRTATDGVLLALALILGFVDSLIPMPIPIAGIKLGLANLVVIFALYRMSPTEAAVISAARVILSGLMFAGMSGIMYSLAGAVLSFTVMQILRSFTDYHVIVVSVCGSIAHILGQLIVAGMLTSMAIVRYYAPILLLSALITGIIIGMLSNILIGRIKLPTDSA
ncbi:MAG: Gx transporter family protein [Lachnospiraceae bacterium]|nr:Gx transporter family protein [Lachnospiraceae bacterium]